MRHIEQLERRALLADIAVGELVGRQVFDDATGATFATNSYQLSLGGDARLMAQLTDADSGAQLGLQFSDTQRFLGFGTQVAEARKLISSDVPAGPYTVSVSSGVYRFFDPDKFFDNFTTAPLITDYRLVLASDRAPGAKVDGSTDFRGDLGRDLGTLPAGEATFVRDFVGKLDSTHADRASASDDFDTYFFHVPVFGSVRMVLDRLQRDVTGGTVRAGYTLFRDADQDNRLEASEVITGTFAGVGQNVDLTRNLNPGRYALVVEHTSGNGFGGTNYRMQFAYTPPDNAGNTLATARLVTLSNNVAQTFSDYSGAFDAFDIYRVDFGAGGPFAFDAILSGIPAGRNFDLDLLNSNGTIIATSQLGAGFTETISHNITTTGAHYVRVVNISGEGNYSLTLRSRNTDLAGNTLGTANSTGSLESRKRFTDSVSSGDPTDFFRFSVPVQTGFQAVLSMTGGNADLQVIHDANNDGVVQAAEVRGSSTSTGTTTELLRNLTFAAGNNYYVRVERISGTPSYQLEMIGDTAPNTISTGRTISLSGASTPTNDFVGIEDSKDYFKFTLGSPLRVGLFASNVQERIHLALGQDTNANNQLDNNEFILSQFVGAQAFDQQFNLAAGNWVVLVQDGEQEPVGTNYALRFASAPQDFAGNTIPLARDLGVLTSQQTFSDSLFNSAFNSMDDLDDFYRFRVADNGTFQFTGTLRVNNAPASSTSHPARLELVRDANLNGRIDAGETIAGVNAVLTQSNVSINPVLTQPGEYFARVTFISGAPNYSLSLQTVSTDTAGNTLAAARNLGALSTTLAANEQVGAIDLTDFFRFSVNSATAMSVAVGLFPNVLVDVIRDANSNGGVDAGEVLATRGAIGAVNPLFDGIFLPAAGDYFVRVQPQANLTTYSLTLSRSDQLPFLSAPFQIAPGSTTTIEAEHFDTGGEGVAYHDTNTRNNNGAFRSNDAVDIKTTVDGGGFRVTDTDAGEFLEYTINVTSSSTYDIAFRLSSPFNGGRMHLAYDGVDISGPIDVPNTGDFDAMATITKTAIFLPEGPAVLRLMMDRIGGVTADSGFTGAINFIRISPSNTGVFETRQRRATALFGTSKQLELDWTVPSRSWRTLQDIEVRLVSRQRTGLRIRWDANGNLFSLFDEQSGEYGPGVAPGNDEVLVGRDLALNLKNTRALASGLNDPSVTLTLEITPLRSAGIRVYRIEAAARDEFGHFDDFRPGGKLRVRAAVLGLPTRPRASWSEWIVKLRQRAQA